MNGKKKLSAASRNALTTAILIVFFLGVILAYYTMLYSETRQRIIKSGELSALSSAERIDKYLSTGVDTIRMASYALDNMIRDGRSQQEILNYLLNQSAAIVSITSGNSPGLYGYVNGEYLDGTGWTPEPGYDPTVRPWYVGPRASIGRVAVVDPYFDLDSQTVMIAFGKTLCDAESVVSMDFSMAPLQVIAREVAEQDDSDMEIVLDRKHQVIAHSDPSEVGKSYTVNDGSFGAALVQGLRTSDEDFFSLRFDGADYIIYTVPVASNWVCLSVCNATSAFGQLKKTLIFTIVALLLIISVVLAIMHHANRKEQLAEELSAEIAAGRTALSVVMVDVNNLKYINDTFGHDAGDEYLCGCCKIICEVYKHSPVFRVGGDEFVVVLQGADHEKRASLAAQLNAAFEQAYVRAGVSPWKHYSASAGAADCEAGDASLEPALKRADQAMYAAKQAFKKEHGSYR